MTNPQLSDLELVEKYKQTGHKNYVGMLFQRHALMVLGVCRKYLKSEEDSKDACMQVFEDLFVKLQTNAIQQVRPWLYTVTKNHCLMQLRKKNNMVSDDFIQNNVEFASAMHLDIEQEKTIQPEQLHNAIGQLNEQQRMCIQLFYIEEKSYQEIMQITALSFKEVKSHIQNGKRNLKNTLTPYYNENE